MRRGFVLLGIVSILSMGATTQIQCPVPALDFVTIEVVNNTPAAIEATFATSPDPLITEDELLEFGDLSIVTAEAGEVVAFDIDCVDAAALILDRADLLVEGGGSVGTRILYLDEDYFCGEIISFDFVASADLAVLDVEVFFFEE